MRKHAIQAIIPQYAKDFVIPLPTPVHGHILCYNIEYSKLGFVGCISQSSSSFVTQVKEPLRCSR